MMPAVVQFNVVLLCKCYSQYLLHGSVTCILCVLCCTCKCVYVLCINFNFVYDCIIICFMPLDLKLLLCFLFKAFLIFLCIVQISDSQGNDLDDEIGNDVILPPKPIDATAMVNCPRCNNGSPCHVVINGKDTNDYTIMDNGSLIVPANDVIVYGTLQCGGNADQLMKYIICPPDNGKKIILCIRGNCRLYIHITLHTCS